MNSPQISLRAFVAAAFVLGPLAGGANAGVILTRDDLNSGIGATGTTETFENWTGSVLSPWGFSTLDSTTVVQGQGPGIVTEGVVFSNINSRHNYNELQLDRRSEYNIPSGSLLAEGGTLVVDFLSPVSHVGFDFFQFNGYSDSATVRVYATDDLTILYDSGLLSAPNAPSATFFGYNDNAGMGKVHLASSTKLWSPLIDNLTFAAVPEPSIGNFWVGDDLVRGGSGAWSATGGTAWAPTDADQAGLPWDKTKTAVFGGTSGGTVTISGTVEANNGTTSVQFATNGYTLTGGTALQLGGSGVIEVTTAGHTAIINTPVTGSVGLTKTGPGTLELGAANTYSGDTNVNAGTLALSTSGSLTSHVKVLNGATFTNNGTVTGNVTVNAGGIRNGSGRQVGNMVVYGTHRPGNSPGVDIIVGNYELGNTGVAPAGRLEMELDNPIGIVPGAAGLTNGAIHTYITTTLGWTANDSAQSSVPLQVGSPWPQNYDPLTNANDLSSALHDALEITGDFIIQDPTGPYPLGPYGTIAVVTLPNELQKGMFFDLFDIGGDSSELALALSGLDDVTMGGPIYLAGGGILNLPWLSSNAQADSWSHFVYDLSLFQSHGIIILVPEPSRVLLVLFALVPLALRRRRQR
jgi:autotransporter-associated beta strand protein